MRLDFSSGRFDHQKAQAKRTLEELQTIFLAGESISAEDFGQTVYEIHGCPSEVEGPPKLLYATTILYPGAVGNEYFMTRGHFHTRIDRGELMFTLSGAGALLLMDRKGITTKEDMREGSVHDVDGRLAHRVANTGAQPLVYLVSWMSDCGHDYSSLAETCYSKLLVSGPTGPILIDNPSFRCPWPGYGAK